MGGQVGRWEVRSRLGSVKVGGGRWGVGDGGGRWEVGGGAPPLISRPGGIRQRILGIRRGDHGCYGSVRYG